MSQIPQSMDEVELSLCEKGWEVNLHFSQMEEQSIFTGSKGTWR